EPAPGLGAGIGAYATDQAAGLAAFTLAGRLWAVDVADGRARRLPARTPVADPRPDPAGQRIAYLCDGSLRVYVTAACARSGRTGPGTGRS
ncbi:MAG: hypothetical protein ACLP52_22890, partial [Streptosporangiaceae bacterium]